MKHYVDNYNGKDWKNWHKHFGEIPIGDLDYWYNAYKYYDERLMWREMSKNHLKWFRRMVSKIYAAKFGESIYLYTDLKLEDLEYICTYYIPPREWINMFMIANDIQYTGTLADVVSKRR